jgi:hypothetical protein
MPIERITPPLDYLQAASRSSLQNFELTRLNQAANLRNEIGTLMDQWIIETSHALLARWILDNPHMIRPVPGASSELVHPVSHQPAALFSNPNANLNPNANPTPRPATRPAKTFSPSTASTKAPTAPPRFSTPPKRLQPQKVKRTA